MINIGIIRWTIAGYVLLGFAAAYNAHATISTDPNQTICDPNMSLVKLLPSVTDPNTAAVTKTNAITGTLALNWLYQGKTPPTPLVGQKKVSFRTEVHPWPYYSYGRDRPFAAPLCYRPWNEYDCENGYGDEFTYPLHYAEVQMILNTQTTLRFGAYFLSDPLSKP
ncbi:MAG: hypothetical protein FJ263_06205 [Planctomycetes bacterium]|nr:hypothetical protein [Planctomycetota bacterium]